MNIEDLIAWVVDEAMKQGRPWQDVLNDLVLDVVDRLAEAKEEGRTCEHGQRQGR